MLNKELLNALNEQMNHEYYAAHAYMAMAAYCDNKSYEGFANFYIQQAKEERFHGKKIYDYINATTLAKLARKASRAAGKKGTDLPGQVARKLDKNILRNLATKVDDIVFISGTNGTLLALRASFAKVVAVQCLINNLPILLAQNIITRLFFFL